MTGAPAPMGMQASRCTPTRRSLGTRGEWARQRRRRARFRLVAGGASFTCWAPSAQQLCGLRRVDGLPQVRPHVAGVSATDTEGWMSADDGATRSWRGQRGRVRRGCAPPMRGRLRAGPRRGGSSERPVAVIVQPPAAARAGQREAVSVQQPERLGDQSAATMPRAAAHGGDLAGADGLAVVRVLGISKRAQHSTLLRGHAPNASGPFGCGAGVPRTGVHPAEAARRSSPGLIDEARRRGRGRGRRWPARARRRVRSWGRVMTV